MFDSCYYKRKYIYELEDGYKCMIELNPSRREYYYFLPSKDAKEGYDIFLRNVDQKPINPDKIESLGKLLQKHGFTDRDFANPFGRTRKLVTVIDVINELQKKTEKTKIKK